MHCIIGLKEKETKQRRLCCIGKIYEDITSLSDIARNL